MAKQTGRLIDDARLRPRDNSGGTMGPTRSAEFGDGGKVTGGENEAGESAAGEDEFVAPPRGRKGGY